MGKNFNLFDKKIEYLLNFKKDNLTLSIDQPQNIRGVVLVLPRDKQFFGFSNEFIKAGTSLGFDKDAGRDEIKMYFEKYGVDAEVEFIFNHADTLLFSGFLKFSTYVDDGKTILIEIDRLNFEDLFRSRYDTKVDLFALQTIDGANIIPLPTKKIKLHAKAISLTAISDLFEVPPADLTKTFEKFTAAIHVLPYTNNTRFNEFNNLVGTPFELGSEGSATIIELEKYQFKAEENGTYSIDFASKLEFFIKTVNRNGVATDSGMVSFHFSVYKAQANADGSQGAASLVLTENLFKEHRGKQWTQTIEIVKTIGLDILKNERLYFYIQMFLNDHPEGTLGIISEVTVLESALTVNSLSFAKSSTAEAFDLVSAFEQNIRLVTNVTGSVLVSDFLAAFKGKYNITNGFRLRNFAKEYKGIFGNLKDFVETLNSIFALGYTFTEVDGKPFIRVEPLMWFFNDVLIHTCDTVFNYSEACATDYLFNELVIGYSKYAEDEFQTLDEFNNYREYLLPIKQFKEKVEKKTKFIASGYLIESTRKLQFEEKPRDSDSNDDDIFILTMSDVDRAKCETNEAFDNISGVIHPESIYNARISPARMLNSWLPFIYNVCFHKAQTELIKCQFWKQNGEMTTHIRPDEFFESPVRENQDFHIREDKKIFIPSISEFETKLIAEDFIRIRASLTARLSDNKNNGYISFVDNAKNRKTGWVLNLEYNPLTEIAKLKILLRHETS